MSHTPLLTSEGGLTNTGIPLTPLRKWSYAIGELGVLGAAALEGFFFQTFLLEVANMNAGIAAIVLLVGQIADTIASPLFGKLSDVIQTRWGRKRVWLFVAAVPFALSYVLLWQTFFVDDGLMFVYYGLIIFCMNFFGNMISVPYGALTVDLANTYDEGTELTQARVTCMFLWSIVVTFFHSAVIEVFHPEPEVVDYAAGYRLSAFILGAIYVVPPLVTAFVVKENPFRAEIEETKGFKKNCEQYFSVMKKRSYVALLGNYLFAAGMVYAIQNNLYLYVKYVLDREDEFRWAILLLQVMAAIGSVLWTKISEKIGKKPTYYISLTLLEICVIILYFINDSTHWILFYILVMFAGTAVSSVFLMPYAMLPDVVADDTQKTGHKREGSFYSLIVFVQKLGLALALSLSSLSLDAAGYINPGDETDQEQITHFQPPAVLTTLRLWMTLIPAGGIIISMIFLAFYNIDTKSNRQK